MIHKILRRFVDIFTVNDKHHLLNRANLMEPIQMQLSQTQKNLRNFLFLFQNLYEILNICQKKINLIADVFPVITAPKNMIR